MTLPSPLKLQWFHILLSLRETSLHGYGIQRAVLDATDGAMTLWPAMLYRSLSTLEEAGLIEEVPTPEGVDEDERRRYYALTAGGRERLAAEASRLLQWAQLAKGGEGS